MERLKPFTKLKEKLCIDDYTDPSFSSNINLYTDRVLDQFTFSFSVKNLFNNTIKYPASRESLSKSRLFNPYRNYLFTINFEL